EKATATSHTARPAAALGYALARHAMAARPRANHLQTSRATAKAPRTWPSNSEDASWWPNRQFMVVVHTPATRTAPPASARAANVLSEDCCAMAYSNWLAWHARRGEITHRPGTDLPKGSSGACARQSATAEVSPLACWERRAPARSRWQPHL